jgi:hypothetical protein
MSFYLSLAFEFVSGKCAIIRSDKMGEGMESSRILSGAKQRGGEGGGGTEDGSQVGEWGWAA